jgi:hypothetical protein
MRRILFLLAFTMLLAGCMPGNQSYFEDVTADDEAYELYYAQDDALYTDPLANYNYLDESLKTQLRELQRLWKEFDDNKNPDADPTQDLHNSGYIAALKVFLSQKESLEVSGFDLMWILGQYGYSATDKTIMLNGIEYTVRLISYNVDHYVRAITDFVWPLNKWIFLQCWNEDDFFFEVISDGDMHSAYEFYPVYVDGTPNIIIAGYSFPYYPQPPFLWAWRFDTDGFTQSNLFAFEPMETDNYYIYNSIDYDNNQCRFVWTFQTNGAFITAERDEDNDWPGLLSVVYDVINDGEAFVFTSSNNFDAVEPDIRISFKEGRYIIE